MQSRRQTRASSPVVAGVLGIPAVPPLRMRRVNRASRSFNIQSVAGASRRLKSQSLEGASRRLNSQSVAERAAPALPGANARQWLRPQYAYGSRSAVGQQFTGRSGAPHMPVRPRIAALQQRCLTCRSTGAPTAGHQRPGRWYAVQFHRPGRCCPTVVARLPLR